MSNATIALVFVVVLNVLMFLTQAAILNINPDAPTFFTNKGTILEGFDKNQGVGDPILDTENTNAILPAGEGTVSPSTASFFTDIFNNIRGWFAEKTGLTYLAGILSAPYNMLKMTGLPNDFTWAVGSMWYIITLFIIVSFFWGRE